MRFLHVVHSCDPAAGGVAEAVLRLANGAEEAGYEAEIITCDSPDADFLKGLGVKATGTGPASRSSYHACPAMGAWLRANAAEFDAFVAHGLWQYPGVSTRREARRANKPYYLYPHGMLDPWFRHTYPLKHLKKLVFWRLRQARILRDARAVCFTTEEERRLARGSFRPYRCEEAVTGLGVAEPPPEEADQRAAFFERFPQLKERRLLLYLGRIHRKKGIDLLLRAFGELAEGDDRLVLAGPEEDGVYAGELRRLAEPFAERVTWAGMLRGATKWGALRSADSLVLPSHQENFGMVVAEALSVGTPVLITDKVNLWREVEDDEAGRVSTDDQAGVRALLREWRAPAFKELVPRTRPCFERRFRAAAAAANLAALQKKA